MAVAVGRTAAVTPGQRTVVEAGSQRSIAESIDAAPLPMTVYRATHAGEFPAVKIRMRLLICQVVAVQIMALWAAGRVS
jgi:hypothetical protein